MSKTATDLQWANLASRVKAKADAADVPTKTSDLTNDSGFLTSVPIASASTLGGIKVGNNLTITADGTLSATANAQEQANWTESNASAVSYIKNKPTLATVATSGSYNDLSNKPTIPTVPTNISAFTNDSNYQTSAQVTAAISSAIAEVTQFRYEVIERHSPLPDTGEVGVIYLKENGGSSLSNVYDEFIWIEEKSDYELIGTTEVDLSNYVTNSDFLAHTTTYASSSNYGHVMIKGLPATDYGDPTSAATVAAAAEAYKHGTWYGTCSSAGGASTKSVVFPNSAFSPTAPIVGMHLVVKFEYANTTKAPSLSLPLSPGSDPIYYNGDTAKIGAWNAGDLVEFVYDGTNWVIVGKSSFDEIGTFTDTEWDALWA